MATMNISLPASLKSFVETQVADRGYSTSSEYVRELLRREQDRSRVKDLLSEGMISPQAGAADEEYFRELRGRLGRTREE